MINWDPLDIIKDAINKLFEAIAGAVVSVLTPILHGIAGAIGTLSPPIITIFIKFTNIFAVGIVDGILYSFFPDDFRDKSKDDNGNWYTNPLGGWNWLCATILDTFFLGIYFVFIVGYFFATKFTQILLTSLPFSMLMTIFTIPFLPMIYFVYVSIKNSQTIAKLSRSIIIGYINEARHNILETKNFFSNNFISISLKIVFIFSYQIFLFMSNIILNLPIVADQLYKFGIIPKILINIIIYFPVWWFLYSLYVNRNSGADLLNKILNAIDSVINTFWFSWDWVNRKTVVVIDILKDK